MINSFQNHTWTDTANKLRYRGQSTWIYSFFEHQNQNVPVTGGNAMVSIRAIVPRSYFHALRMHPNDRTDADMLLLFRPSVRAMIQWRNLDSVAMGWLLTS